MLHMFGVPRVYHRAHVFVSPTYAEGFSNTILEAMASRLAVVSCRSVGVVDCIRDGENGLLTEPGDRAGLAHALRLREETGIAFPLVQADAERTPFRDASFDVVYCLRTFPHLGYDTESSEQLGRQILREANHPLVTSADTMDSGADKAAELAHSAK